MGKAVFGTRMKLAGMEESQTETIEPKVAAIRPLTICIVGWYFRAQFLKAIKESGYSAFVVRHRTGDTQGIPYADHPNLGLEFGAYRQYVENHWDGTSDILFLHDDTDILNMGALALADSLGQMGIGHAYIFSSAYEELVNGGAHGRGMWMSADTIRQMADDFPADMENTGTNVGVVAQQGIFRFHKRVKECGPDTGLAAIIPSFYFGHRGTMNDKVIVFKRLNVIPGAILNA